MPKCKTCNNEYQVNGTDDGYCCFDCWEIANCSSPELVLAEENDD
jgi:tRNA(Ile2) C34 agmatinyltransferase TiaS